MSFSENLKQIRREHHLSQEALAELLDVSRQAVSKWEQGQGYPEVEKLLLLSSKLNISLDALMSIEINRDAGVKKVRWVSVEDARRCKACADLDGKIFSINDIPSKQHRNCRCYVVPVE